ncbi:MAG TPA: hypothetical protein VFI25_00320 [Planctomycetota bacterium]|nr:hypothetical protein [Planctomycetota bacterium]
MIRSFFLEHAALFLLISAVIALALSAYGQDDLRKILRAAARRLVVFTAGVALLGVVMGILGNFVLSVG